VILEEGAYPANGAPSSLQAAFLVAPLGFDPTALSSLLLALTLQREQPSASLLLFQSCILNLARRALVPAHRVPRAKRAQ
jgi:hypothetical protein